MRKQTLGKQVIITANQQPIDVLIQFMKEMNQWEKQRWEEQEKIKENSKNILQQLRHEYVQMNKIFKKYCIPKKRVNNIVGAYSFPPEYDPDNEIILETVIESNRRVVIYTKQKLGFRLFKKYVLLKKRGQWLIDNKQWRADINQKWERGIL